MRHLKKWRLIFSSLLVLFIQKGFAQETKRLYWAEYLNGRAKSIIETDVFADVIYTNKKDIITEFDNNHHFFKCHIAVDPKVDTLYKSIEFFDDKYIKPTKDQDTTDLYYVDIFNKDGNKIGSKSELKNKKIFYRNKLKYGKYDFGNNVTEFCIYNSNDSLVFKQGYVFNNFNQLSLLTEIDNYSNDHQITDRIIFKYLAFDKKGNWIKRYEIGKSHTGLPTKFVKTLRKITYGR